MTEDNRNPPVTPPSRRILGRASIRFVLLVFVPLLILVGSGVIYLLGGRYEDTENAYVRADMVSVVPEVSGVITRVSVDENQVVGEGAPLFRIDSERYRIAARQAEAELADVRTRIETLKAQYREQEEQLKTARSNLAFARREYQRQVELSPSHAVSDSVLDRYRHDEELARQAVVQAARALERLKAGLAGEPDIAVTEHPMYREAEASLAAARKDLDDTRVTARFAGIASKTPVVGQYVGPGHAAMSLVATDRVWVEANLKETQLTHVREGQPVAIEVDAYPDQELSGHVASIAGATGSEFSVLPAQNATGNWVKVVQRVPVRIELDTVPESARLRSGMSVTVEIDTGWHHRGPGVLSSATDWVRGLVGSASAADEEAGAGQ